MYKKVVAMLLVLSLLAMAGCSSTDTGSAATATEVSTANSSVEETVSAPVVEEAPASNLAESASEAIEPSSDAVEDAVTISYPISDGSDTLTLWKAWDSGYSAFFESYSDLEALKIVEEDTGVKLEITEVSEDAASEQFNLMAASETWTDLVNVSMYYTGGITAAYADDIIYDLTDYLEVYMPDYYAMFQRLNDTTQKSLTSDDGRIYTLASLSEDTQQVQGLAIRQDWLNDLSLDVPTTIDEFTDVMRAFHNTYDCDYTIYVDKTGVVNHVYGAFGTNAFGVSASFFGGSTLAFYQNDGTVYSGLQSDGYRDYLTWFIEMYNEGLINKDFYTESLSSADDEAIQSGGETGAFHVRAEKFSVLTEYAEDEDYELVGIAPITMDEGDTYEFSDSLTQTGRNNINITTACDDLELAMEYLNYFFTDQGYITYNYGIEGLSYEFDDNGNPQYTALITEDTNANQMVTKYTCNIMIGAEDATALYGSYWQSELDAMELWTETMGSACTMPNVSLTTDESNSYSAIAGDLITFAQEYVLRFITSELTLDDANWEAFQEDLSAMNIDECVAIYQTALDRYNGK